MEFERPDSILLREILEELVKKQFCGYVTEKNGNLIITIPGIAKHYTKFLPKDSE